ncbi:MAG: hypothetical protein AAF921_28225 [Cyanobacteria bacterium P01_D01_bin.44]
MKAQIAVSEELASARQPDLMVLSAALEGRKAIDHLLSVFRSESNRYASLKGG